MQRYIMIRLLHACIALFAVSIIIFSLARVTGNPLDVLLPDEATQADYDRVSKVWGLDRPLHEQYLTYMSNVFRGNFGDSIKWRDKSVRELLLGRLPATLQLASFALVVAAGLALPIGVVVAVKKDTGVDFAGKIIALLGQSMPSFWLGIVLMWIFAVQLDWLPTSGRGGIEHMILPSIALGWFQVAAVMRLTRSSMLEVLDTEYVKLARIKGVAEWKVIWKHCLRNAALAPLTYFGLIMGGFIAGSVVIETVFSWPGVGLLSIEAVRARDFQVVQSVVIFFAFIYIMSSLIVDVLYAYLDPRIRYN
ncbi:MAG TPA: ABC transporter permease [Dehalococcoidia bacterium]|nr:ABC transporter permease [Dehalococcoidia bacterium]